MLKQRILTALILLPLMIAMLFYAPTGLWLLFTALITLLALWEWGRMCQLPNQTQSYYLGGTALFMLTAIAGQWQLPSFIWLIVGLFWLIAMPLWLKQKWTLRSPHHALIIGWLMMLPFWFGLQYLRPTAEEASTLFAIMILVWLADTAAYFTGRAFGKTPLAPVISPKKSWEGAAGGLLAVLLYLTIARHNHWLFENYSWFSTMVMGTILTFVSIGGDLLESWFKRTANIKDSSQLLPGHGGIYDRTDSLIAVISLYAAIHIVFN